MSRVREHREKIKTASLAKYVELIKNSKNDKKLLFSRKQVTTYLLEFRRINTFHTLYQGVNSQCSHRESFQL